jgi:hypothetical protein
MKEAAIEGHDTPTSDSAWDGPAVVAAIPSTATEADLKSIFAWEDDEGDPLSKGDYKFPHHNGVDGPANLKASSAGIAALNGGRGGADIPPEDRQGVYDHLVAHLKAGDPEAEVPDLTEADLNEDADKLAMLVDMLGAASDLAQKIAAEYADAPAPKPDAKPDAQPPVPPEDGGMKPEAFDPKDRKSLELLAAAMLKDPNWAMEVQKVAASLSPTEVDGDFVALTERAVAEDGTTLLRVITPGWGSSGYYSPELLERDGPKVFPLGTKMFWNHQTDAEEASRPEGDLRDLAGELIEDAAWHSDGPEGAGLYAKAKVFAAFQPVVEELAPHIGVSIRAMGKATNGTVEGREGPIIDSLTHGRSVDFVTAPGAGGKVMSLFEAARPSSTEGNLNMDDQKELTEAREELKAIHAGAIITTAVGEAKLPDAAVKRLTEALPAKAVLNDEGKLDEDAFTVIVTEAIASEVAYLTEVTGAGSIVNMGGAKAPTEADTEATLAGAFQTIGLPESTAKIAAAGRK